MKKLSIILFAALLAIVSLTSCAPSTESSDWLKGTTWKADLAGVQYRENGRMGLSEDYQTMEDGYITIHFTTNGYKLQIDSKYMKAIVWAKLFPDYDFPSLYFPISWEEENKQPVNIIYNEGTLSDDFKTIHFESFRDKGHEWSDFISFTEFKDLVFRRK